VIKGRFLGKLRAENSLTIHSGAEIKGSFTAGRLIIPAKNRFRWSEPLAVGSAEIAGELTADIVAEQTIILRSTGILFGNTEARNLIVEPGAVLVGNMRIGEPSLREVAAGSKAERKPRDRSKTAEDAGSVPDHRRLA
jgi:cytoskeletal protein CcmA (bactofilin family)